MKNKEINKLSTDELKKKANSLKKDLFNIRFKKVNGQVKSHSKINETKKNIARLKTLIEENNA